LKCGFGVLKKDGVTIIAGFFKNDKPYGLGMFKTSVLTYYMGIID
jgi:hypothetical protein